MNLPVDALTWTGAALPIVVLLVLLVYRRWSAVEAGSIGAVAAIIVACTLYRTPADVLAGEIAKAVWNSVSILAVIFPAILIYEVNREAGSFKVIERELARLIPDKLLQILTIGWCFSSFLQGPSGFGVPIAVTAPLLISISVRPLWAVLIPLLAHAWANTFGTLALAWEALVQQTGISGDAYWQAAWWTGILTGMLCLLAGGAICWFYGGLAALRRGCPAVLLLGGIQAGGQLLLSQIAPTLSTVIATSAAMGAAFWLARTRLYRQPAMETSPILSGPKTVIPAPAAANGEKEPRRLTFHEAMLPYYLLVAISIFVLLTPPVTRFLGQWQTGFSFPETVTGYGVVNPAHAVYSPVSWLTHSGFFLLLSAVLSALYFAARGCLGRAGVGRSLRDSTRKFAPAAISTAFLLVMSKVMGGSGQVDVLARGTAVVAGDFFILLSPMVGMIGSFMSASNVSSNILFGQFQASIASLTGKSSVLFLAAQTSGGAIGTMLSPSKILLGTTTANIVGSEGEIIRKLLGIACVAAVLTGVIVFVFA